MVRVLLFVIARLVPSEVRELAEAISRALPNCFVAPSLPFSRSGLRLTAMTLLAETWSGE